MIMMIMMMIIWVVFTEHTVYILVIVKNKWCIRVIEGLNYTYFNHYSLLSLFTTIIISIMITTKHVSSSDKEVIYSMKSRS
jgi:hypothetical protein